MPKNPVIQHQKTAPGPPKAIAVETPTILPVPRVAAKVVASAPKLLNFESETLSGVIDSFIALRVFF